MERETARPRQQNAPPADCACGGDESWNLTGDKNGLRAAGSPDGRMHAALAEEFDAWARAGRGAEMESGHRPAAEQALARFPFGSMRSFLDAGCGNGYAVRHAAAHMPVGGLALGLDLSGAMLRVARATDVTAGSARIGYVRSGFGALPFADASLDGLFSHEAIYYAVDVGAALREFQRVLRTGALGIITLDYYEENEYSHEWPRACGMPMTLDSEAGWCRRLEHAGFVDVSTARLLHRGVEVPPPGPEASSRERARHGLRRRFLHEEGTLMLRGVAGGAA